MELVTCTHCGVLIEGEGIRHRRRFFCSDPCCEKFEDQFLDHGEPDDLDLEGDDDLESDALFEGDDDLYEDDATLDEDDDF